MVNATGVTILLWVGLMWAPLGHAASVASETSEMSETPEASETATEDQAPGEPTLEERVRAILDSPPEGDGVVGEIVRCIRTFDYDSVDILDAERLVFKGRGGKRWLNQLRMKCPGLRRRDPLSFEIRSNRLCEFDSFRSIDVTGYGGASPKCSLGRFEPITEDQVQMLKDALRAGRS